MTTKVKSSVIGDSIVLTGTPLTTSVANGTYSLQIATAQFVANTAKQAVTEISPFIVPSGGIIIWSGAQGAIPSGWALCDGSNGTPDLRDRFVIGAGTSYTVGNSGGSKDAVVVSHTHTLTDPGHTHRQTNNAPDVDTGTLATGGNSSGSQYSGSTVTSSASTQSATTGITVNSSGVSGTNANLPPYYALCYIMKL